MSERREGQEQRGTEGWKHALEWESLFTAEGDVMTFTMSPYVM